MEFSRLGELYEELEKLRSRNEMVKLVSDFLKNLEPKEVEPTCSMLLGPTLGVGWATIRDAILKVTGLKRSDFHEAFSGTGDLGEASKILFGRRRVRTIPLVERPLTISEVWEILRKIGSTSSLEHKKRLLEGLLNKCSPVEAKFLVKVLLGEMRAGFSEGLLKQALAKAYGVSEEKVKIVSGFVALPEIGAALGKGEGLESFVPRIFHPISPMLAESVKDVGEALREHQGKTSLELKLDGARVQVHVSGGKIVIFSRGRENVTPCMPEVVEQVRRLGMREAILEGEVIALKDGSPLPFQLLMRRFRRTKIGGASEIPLKLYLFDLLFLDGKWMLEEPYSSRREKLVEIGGESVVEAKIVSSENEGKEFLQKALLLGHEGIMAKMPEGKYLPGRREKFWLKIKPAFTLDLVIVAAEWGHGRRAKYLSDYYLAALDEKTGKFEVVGKTFKGLTNEELEEMTKRLKQLQTETKGRTVFVRPEIVVEVSFNQVQKSPKYPCGMALRFARIERIRDDKRPEEADTIERIRSLLPSSLKKQ
jgi:DNA ligase-1